MAAKTANDSATDPSADSASSPTSTTTDESGTSDKLDEPAPQGWRGRLGRSRAAVRAGGTALGRSAAGEQVRRGLALTRASHPRQLVLTALALALAAFVAGRPVSEVALVALTVAVGQAILGWHNDLVDAEDDRRAERAQKPIASGALDPTTAWFAIAVAALMLIPLAVANGMYAAACYAGSVAAGLVGNVILRGNLLSWLPWAVSYALFVPFLSYGGLGGQYVGEPPSYVLMGLAAALGVCVHFLRALPGLVQDNRDRRRHLPLRVATHIGAPRLLLISTVATIAVVVGILLAGARFGLSG